MKRYALLFTCFLRQMWLLAVEAGIVVFYVRAMKAGLLDECHPWAVGNDVDGTPIWPKNVVYASPRKIENAPSDAEIVIKVGQFLRSMVKRSVGINEIPQGPRRRMPHAVNYLHGSVHYNGGFIVFDDCKDLVSHVNDPAFRRDLARFVKAEKREVTIVLRDRDYDPTEYAYAISAVRAHLPYFTNGNGPSDKPVLWGNKAPYASLNPINGAWMDDMRMLWKGELDALVRPPVAESYFADKYVLVPRGYTKLEKSLAWLYFLDVRARGKRGNIFFSARETFDPRGVAEYKALGYWRWFNIARVPRPNFLKPLQQSVSVIIPTLNEASCIENAIQSAKQAFNPMEIIVVDAGSTDQTRELASALGATVLQSAPGRGQQMAHGASCATGDLLVFLHADTQVDLSAGHKAQEFFAASETNQVATLRLRFDARNPLYRPLGWVTRLDGYLFSYGDQGIICRRSFHDAIGGMPQQPLFEDVEFFRRARRVARVSSLPARIHVSARRFRRRGIMREVTANTHYMWRYAKGESAQQLCDEYRKTEPRT